MYADNLINWASLGEGFGMPPQRGSAVSSRRSSKRSQYGRPPGLDSPRRSWELEMVRWSLGQGAPVGPSPSHDPAWMNLYLQHQYSTWSQWANVASAAANAGAMTGQRRASR